MRSKQYESISFEVEKGLKPPTEGFYKKKIENILSLTFSKPKQSEDEDIKLEDSTLSMSEEDEPLEILHYNLDTEEKSFFNRNKKSLIQGLIAAYKKHYPITISPDMIWILFLQGYSRFMEKYHEKVRFNYVNFENKKKLSLFRNNMVPEKATNEVWNSIIEEFTQKIKNEVGENLISNLESDFTTTTPVSLITSQVSIMSSMKNYFEYGLEFDGCGISSITLEGSLEDWQKIKSKFEFFSKKEMGLLWWIEHLMPIIDKIIMTKVYYSQKKEINEEIKNFWKDIIRIKEGECYDPTLINGWIIKFIPDLSGNEPKLYDDLEEDDVPDQIIGCPMELTVINNDADKEKTKYKCSLESGFYGMIQDENTYNIKPVIGYAIVVEDKESSTKSIKN